MAKSRSSYFGSHGSQFFILLEDSPTLSPDYTAFGEVTGSMDTIDKIGNLAVRNNVPIENITIKKIRVVEQ